MGGGDQERRPRRIGLNTSMTIDGRTLLLREWAEESGHPPSRLIQRLKADWSDENAVKRPQKAAAQKPGVGERFDLWTVVDAGKKRYAVLCECRCGKRKPVAVADLQLGKSRGCRSCSVSGQRSPTHRHGRSKDPLHKVWQGLLSRCEIPTATGFKNYGGRGIEVCDRWKGRSGFKNFAADMGERPSWCHTLERVDNDGHYEPSNCKWVTRKQQNRNARRTRLLTHKGRTQCVTDWAEELAISRSTIQNRLRRGLSVATALDPKGLRRPKEKRARGHDTADDGIPATA